MSLAHVAIVGRPNVGKSTLFNRLAGENISIVDDQPGITRDRVYTEIEWLNNYFMLIDTGGLDFIKQDEIVSNIKRQAEIAIHEADVILFIVDGKSGVTSLDQEIALMLRKTKKPVILVCNKVDNIEMVSSIYEFYNLGLGEPIAISAAHGLGIGDLLDEIIKDIPRELDSSIDQDCIKIAVVGKPNAGKSSLINHILGEERLIVTDMPGTTRDAIDTRFETDDRKYIFIDTAGIRRKSRVLEDLERYSVVRSFRSIRRADVVLLVIDAVEGPTEQDAKIIGYAHEQGKAIIIIINKWDLIEKDDKTVYNYKERVYNTLSFVYYAPVLFISAKTGKRTGRILENVDFVFKQNSLRVSTGVLNEIISEAVALAEPPSDKGKKLKIFYSTQVSIRPPTFALFVNSKDLMHFSYMRYIENQIRNSFGFEGTPIRILIREKKKDR
ncbi:MAG: ribosome biogenesis GTPase Der [Clostridia bacterium]|nr:ribosome biogenesis GTPase Der [Clostridia bacterium]